MQYKRGSKALAERWEGKVSPAAEAAAGLTLRTTFCTTCCVRVGEGGLILVSRLLESLPWSAGINAFEIMSQFQCEHASTV
jgi:hypothetical protein